MSTRRSDPITFPGPEGRSLSGLRGLSLFVQYWVFRLSTVSSIALATGSGSPSRSITCAISQSPLFMVPTNLIAHVDRGEQRAVEEGCRALKYFDGVTMRGARSPG